MSNAETRAALAAAVTTVDGLTGYPERPDVPREGDGWPQWRGGERADGFAFINTWVVLVMLPETTTNADAWADQYGEQLADALQPVMFVDRIDPATVKLSNNDALALMITGRSE